MDNHYHLILSSFFFNKINNKLILIEIYNQKYIYTFHQIRKKK